MPEFHWRDFLTQFSIDLLANPDLRSMLPGDVVESKWLGFPAASEEEILSLESRLSTQLPPSYRSFLLETNGWRNCGYFIYQMWNCDQVRWFSENNQEWIDAYMHPERSGARFITADGREEIPTVRPVPDDEYFVYGKGQSSCDIRPEYLQSALEISDVGDSAILLLNPKVSTPEGEWEAWFFGNWLPGATRYPSFRELMECESESIRRLNKPT